MSCVTESCAGAADAGAEDVAGAPAGGGVGRSIEDFDVGLPGAGIAGAAFLPPHAPSASAASVATPTSTTRAALVTPGRMNQNLPGRGRIARGGRDDRAFVDRDGAAKLDGVKNILFTDEIRDRLVYFRRQRFARL